MRLWKVDDKAWTVRPVEGEMFPEQDEEGDICYTNTHFRTEDEAWAKLSAEAEAFASLSSRSMKTAEERLATCLTEYITATKVLLHVRALVRDRKSKAEMVAGEG